MRILTEQNINLNSDLCLLFYAFDFFEKILLIFYSFSKQHYHQQQTSSHQCNLHSDTASAKRLWSDHLMMKRIEEVSNQTAGHQVISVFVYFSF